MRRPAWFERLALLGALGVALLNVAAYCHARAIMRFVPSGTRTAAPESLSTVSRLQTLVTGVTVPRPVNLTTPAAHGLPFETHRIPDGDGWLEAWLVRRDGASRWALLFHGYAGSKTRLLDVARRLYDLDFNLLLADFHGSGGSSGNEHSLGFHEGHDVALATSWAARVLGVERPLLYGISMGGAAILRAQGTTSLEPGALILESVFDRMLTTVRHRFGSMGLPSFPAAELLVLWGGVRAGFNGFTHNPAQYAAHVRCPTLVLQGDRDPRVHVTEGRAIYERLQGPKQLYLAHTGHGVSGSMDVAEWRAAVAATLGSMRTVR